MVLMIVSFVLNLFCFASLDCFLSKTTFSVNYRDISVKLELVISLFQTAKLFITFDFTVPEK